MFYGNNDLLEKNLHNDLNTLIKNIKIREDQHLTLLQYNKGLVQQLGEMDSIPFFQEQLNKHKSFLDSIRSSDSKIKGEQQQMLEKYTCTISGESSIVKLMGRVTARVMEILQASLEKSKTLDSQLQKKYINLKNSLLDSVNNRDKIDINELLTLIIQHSQQKSKEEIDNLQKIIDILVSGNFSDLGSVYEPVKKQVKEPVQKTIIPKPSLEKKQAKKALDRSREKIRQDAEKAKKKKTKLARQMLSTLYSTMDIHKNQFMEDMVFNNREEKKKFLYEEVFSRNKLNHAQILSFEAEREKFQSKVKAFKQQMEKQSQKIQQALVFAHHNFISGSQDRVQEPFTARLPPKKQKSESPSVFCTKQVKSEANEEINNDEQRFILPDRQKSFRRRQKKQSAIKAPTPKLTKQTAYISMQSTQQVFRHLKFQLKNENQLNRNNQAKLPHLSGRSSLDSRYQQKKKQQPEKRINIVKNIEIGNFNPQLKPIAPQNQRKSPREPRERLVPQGNGFEYTFYVKKKTSKLYQTKNNFFF